MATDRGVLEEAVADLAVDGGPADVVEHPERGPERQGVLVVPVASTVGRWPFRPPRGAAYAPALEPVEVAVVDGDDPGQDGVDVVNEVGACFEAYERALLTNDVGAMDAWFWDDPGVVRFGIAECQYGPEEIAEWRRAAAPVPPDRRHVHTTVVAHGDDLAVVTLEFANGDRPGRGRQSQVWARTAAGWRVVHAHVSMID